MGLHKENLAQYRHQANRKTRCRKRESVECGGGERLHLSTLREINFLGGSKKKGRFEGRRGGLIPKQCHNYTGRRRVLNRVCEKGKTLPCKKEKRTWARSQKGFEEVVNPGRAEQIW